MLNIRKISCAAMLLSSVLLCACHPKVDPVSKMDKQLSCSELRQEISKVKDIKAEICSKRGFSGRNVALGVLFWPGILVNEASGDSAETAANARLAALQDIYAEKCVANRKG